MKVALTVNDFLRRAEEVYGDRVGVIDEPDQPAPSWGQLGVGAHVTGPCAGGGTRCPRRRDGDRVAIVSQNSARLLTSFWGVAGAGRVLVPINFRLNADEVGYIVEHSGRPCRARRPELDESLSGVKAEHRFVLGAAAERGASCATAWSPRPWQPDEDATATINYTSGTTARPKGVELTHRNCWLNAAQFGWHMGVSDRDVYLHTLPMFHADGWGMPFAVTGMGGTHVVLRKVDGAEILRRIEAHGVTLLCGAPAVAAAVLDAAATWDGPVPGAGTVRMAVAGAAAHPRGPSSGWRPARVGVTCRSTGSPRRRRS